MQVILIAPSYQMCVVFNTNLVKLCEDNDIDLFWYQFSVICFRMMFWKKQVNRPICTGYSTLFFPHKLSSFCTLQKYIDFFHYTQTKKATRTI